MVWTLAQGFAIGPRGFAFESLGRLFGEVGSQYGMGLGAALVITAFAMLFALGLALRGFFKGDGFVAGSVVAVAVLVAAFTFFPVIKVLVSAIEGADGSFSPGSFTDRLFTAKIWGLGCVGGGTRCGVAWNTLALAVACAVACTGLGLAFALVATRTRFRHKKLLRVLSVLPIITPPFVIGLGLILIFGRSGLVNQFLEWIVTCGGLCPGLNNVIRATVMQLWHGYGVRRISGVRYGYEGFIPSYGLPLLDLDPDVVRDIHLEGGTILGSSRGEQSTSEMVDMLERQHINALFTLGGDGTLRGALKIYEEVTRRGHRIALVGVPKTIDNDIPMISRTFGFDTAVDTATVAIRAAHVEAMGAPRGVGVVKLMGRHSGYIASSAALACRDVNLVLVPEQRFDLDGEKGVLAWLEKRLAEREHAGAGPERGLAV